MARIIGIVAATVLLAGIVAADFGYVSNVSAIEVPSVEEPEDQGLVDTILAPFKWVWNMASPFFTLLSFQIDGIPPVIGILIGILDLVIFYVVVRLIRGGG